MVHGTVYGSIAGIVLAAGYGTRMRPLTNAIPKSLLPVLGVPLLELIVERLLRLGAARIHMNLHHLADRIAKFAADRDWPITFHHEPELLGTGGGIGNMGRDLSGNDLIILQNGDIISGIDFAPAISLHHDRGVLVTMIVIPGTADLAGSGVADTRRPPAAVHVDRGGTVTAISTDRRFLEGGSVMGYTGMAVLSPSALRYFPRGEPGGLVETLLAIIAAEPGSVAAYDPVSTGANASWGEIGSCAGYLDIHRRILIEKTLFDPSVPPPPFPLHVGEGSKIETGSQWHGFLVVGSGVTIERDVILEDCVVLDGTVVAAGSSHRRTVLFPDGLISIEETEVGA